MDAQTITSAKTSRDHNEAGACPPTTRPIQDSVTDKRTGIRANCQGITYQLKLLMLFIYRAHKNGRNFSLGTEVEDAEKFDDVVFSCQKEDNSGTEYRFLQAKHKHDGNKVIKTENILSESKDDFSILKYMISYQKIKKNPKFRGEVKDLTICTNMGLHKNVLESMFETDSTADEIFGNGNCSKSKLYKFRKNSEIYNKLKNIFKGIIDKLAACVAKVVINNDIGKDPLMLCYRGWLLDNVYDVDDQHGKSFVSFQKNFLNNNCGGEVINFKRALIKSYCDLTNENKSQNNVDTVLQDMDFELHSTFKKDKGVIISPEVSDSEIDEFFDKLVLAVKQPNEFELWKMIKSEISKDMNLFNDEIKATKYLDFMLEWINENKNRFLKQEDINKLFLTLEQSFARTALTVFCLVYKSRFETNCKFKDDVLVIKTVKNIMQENNKQNQILNVYHKVHKLSIVKILQACADTKADQVIFCNLKDVTRLMDTSACPIKAFSSESCNHLVIDIESTAALDKTEESFLKEIVKCLREKKTKRINLLVPFAEKKSFEYLLKNLFMDVNYDKNKYDSTVDDDNNFRNLTVESQQKLIKQCKITLQGSEVTLNSLVGSDTEWIKGEILSKLIFNEIINVGQASIQASADVMESREYYVDRTLQRCIHINKNIMIQNDKFYITFHGEIEEADLKTDQEIVLICDKQSEFDELCKNCKNTAIHWLKDDDESVAGFRDIPILQKVEYNESDDKLETDTLFLISDNEDEFINLCEKHNEEVIYWLRRRRSEFYLQDCHNFGKTLNVCEDRDINNKITDMKQCLVVLPNSQVTEANLQSCKVIIFVSKRKVDLLEFLEQHKDSPLSARVIYWIKGVDTFIWNRSKGTIAKLREFVEDIQDFRETYSPNEVMFGPDRVTIIAAEPGMGKTTLLTHLATSVVNDALLPILWVVKIDLKRYMTELESIELNKKNISVALNFLYKAATETLKDDVGNKEIFRTVTTDETGNVSFNDDEKVGHWELNLFTDLCNRGKVAVFFDAYDEICPDLKFATLHLMEILKATKIRKILVTTRPYNIQSELEISLRTFAYQITPLRANEQKYILTKFLEKELSPMKINKKRSEKFVDTLLEILTQQFTDECLFKFNSIPLQIIMIATVYKDQFENFCCAVDSEFKLSSITRNLDIYNLFMKFLNIKLKKIYSCPANLTQRNDFNEYRRLDTKELCWFALCELVAKDAMNKLLSDGELAERFKEMQCLKRREVRTGLIDRVTDDGKPQFIHRLFAEVLAADLLGDMLNTHSKGYNSSSFKFIYDYVVKSDSQLWTLLKILNYKLVANSSVKDDRKAMLIGLLNGDWRTISQQPYFLSIRDSLDRSAVHLACCCIEQCKDMLMEYPHLHQFDFTAQDELFKFTPLHYAVLALSYYVATDTETHLERLLELSTPSGCNARDVNGKTPLILAIQLNCDIHMIQIMTRHGLELDITDNSGRTALHCAADHPRAVTSHRLAYARHLIECGADPFIKDNKGKTPLHIIFQKHDIAMWTVYFTAIVKKKLQKELKKLLQDILRNDGATVIPIPVEKPNAEILKKTDHLPRPSRRMSNVTISAVNNDFKVWLISNELLEGVEFLLENSLIDSNTRDSKNRTALHYAAGRCENLHILDCLLRHKAAVNVKDASDRTPLHYASNETKVRKLLEAGAYFDVVNTVDMPEYRTIRVVERIFNSVRVNNKSNVERILKKHKEIATIAVNAKSRESDKSPLDYAAQHGSKGLIECLVSHGARRFSLEYRDVNISIRSFCSLHKGNKKYEKFLSMARTSATSYRSTQSVNTVVKDDEQTYL